MSGDIRNEVGIGESKNASRDFLGAFEDVKSTLLEVEGFQRASGVV